MPKAFSPDGYHEDGWSLLFAVTSAASLVGLCVGMVNCVRMLVPSLSLVGAILVVAVAIAVGVPGAVVWFRRADERKVTIISRSPNPTHNFRRNNNFFLLRDGQGCAQWVWKEYKLTRDGMLCVFGPGQGKGEVVEHLLTMDVDPDYVQRVFESLHHVQPDDDVVGQRPPWTGARAAAVRWRIEDRDGRLEEYLFDTVKHPVLTPIWGRLVELADQRFAAQPAGTAADTPTTSES